MSPALANCSPIMIAEDQHRRHQNFADQVTMFNAPAVPAKFVKVDVNWIVDGRPIMFDIKTPSDLVASVSDGRLHDQMESMQNANCLFYGIFQVGEWHDNCGYDEDAYDNTMLRLQLDGADIVRAGSSGVAARRLASLWRWTRDSMSKAGSYHVPAITVPSNDMTRQPPLIFWDKTFRRQVGMIMSLPECGPVMANMMREQLPLMDVLGITEEGLTNAKARWIAMKGIGKKTVASWEAFLRA